MGHEQLHISPSIFDPFFFKVERSFFDGIENCGERRHGEMN